MAYEAVLLGLMVIPGITAYREGGNKGHHAVVYRDGVAFYACLFGKRNATGSLVCSLPHLFSLIHYQRSYHQSFSSKLSVCSFIVRVPFVPSVIGRSEISAEAITVKLQVKAIQ